MGPSSDLSHAKKYDPVHTEERNRRGSFEMKRDKLKRSADQQLIDHPKVGDRRELEDVALSKASAEYYERCWQSRIKDARSDWWIAIGLYLILSSVAFVVL